MTNSVQDFRCRQANRGRRRVEVAVPACDADLIRQVAKALASDDAVVQRLREALQDQVLPKAPIKFQDWLASPTQDEQ